MNTATFQEGRTYEATGHFGNAFFTVLSRTEKTITITANGFPKKRLKVHDVSGKETIYYGAWSATPQYSVS